MIFNICDETAPLKAVVVGTPEKMGKIPTVEEAYDPKSKMHIKLGTYPTEHDLIPEMNGLADVLKKHGVNVLRPQIIDNCNQVFSRDIGFVIGDKFIRAGIIEKRMCEMCEIDALLSESDPGKVISVPDGVHIEGGDVIVWKDYLFIGYSEQEDFDTYEVSRTNPEGIAFMKELFPEKKIKAFELNKSDTDPYENILHLDCCFQPIGKGEAIIYRGGFKNEADFDFLVDFFGKEHIIEIDKMENYQLFSNVFSISPDVIVIEESFERLNLELEERGYTVEKVKYAEVAKMEGLLRCTTLPLAREC
jgi:N-dimethylarginine dimethylaminohydrolase